MSSARKLLNVRAAGFARASLHAKRVQMHMELLESVAHMSGNTERVARI